MADQPDQEYAGASATQIMFHAIQASNLDLLKEALAMTPGPNLEGTNSIGDSPVLACLRNDQSLDALAIILEEEVDVDLGNAARDGDRPLHLAVLLDDEEQREWCGESSLELKAKRYY
jgi:hypothetical protein